MKLNLMILLALLGSPLAFADEKHDHGKETKEEHAGHDHDHDHGDHDDHDHDHGDEKKGPNGGHLVESKSGIILEVVVDKERKARVTFLDKDKKAAKLEAQTITGTAGERSAPVKLAFAKGKDDDANVLISDKALPEGAHVAMILVIKTAADAKAVTERFELHLH
ncbi:hypothetical protein OKA04_18590 [Luteolibacter flavescens]|uniref:Uncharacterized protein n=1 Tax=Luteolibacter flavescens TaxID=1859460 RepID=A0ABT3FTW0_9BACT|nr:hypothetical protein [Luteolibacter flavescens]MCW1886754.1 hypothetical protein [Luteolibacter flavescens]